jgi:iron complex outermembrane receptor protein
VELEVDIGDVRTRTFGAVSASAGALYDFGGGVGVGVSVARAFRTPDVTELYSQGPHLATYSVEIGNPDLGAETGLGTDLFLRITRDQIKGEVAAFRNAISHYIFPRQTGETDLATGLPIYRFVGENAVLAGLEGRTEWSVTNRLVLDGSASYVRGTLTDTDEPLPLIPPLSGRLGVRYETTGYFLGAGAKVASRQDRLGEFEEPTAGYRVFDAMAGYRWIALGRAHTLTLRADNITDTVYRDHLSRIKEIMPQPGRSISLLYRVNF